MIQRIPFGHKNDVRLSRLLSDHTVHKEPVLTDKEDDISERGLVDIRAVDDDDIARPDPRQHAAAENAQAHAASHSYQPDHLGSMRCSAVVHSGLSAEAAADMRNISELDQGFRPRDWEVTS